MREEVKNRLMRQVNLGVDKGLRLELRWESGFTVTVHSWEAAAVITKAGLQKRQNSKNKASTFRVNFYQEVYADGIMCVNPDTMSVELCFVALVQNARRGPSVSDEVRKRKEKEVELKVQARAVKLRKAELELERLRAKHA